MIFVILLGFFLAGNLFFMYMFWRNTATHRFLIELLEQIHVACNNDANQNREWKWRYEAFNKVHYNRVLWTWWAPLKPEAYWDDLAFLDHSKHLGA